VIALMSVGCLGWRLPDTSVIDELGLNDWVVARTPVAPPDPESLRAPLRAAFDAADTDRSGWLDEAELRSAIAATVAPGLGEEVARSVIAVAPARHPGRLEPDEFEDLASSFVLVRKMAHERRPPPGYVDGFRPNVRLEAGGASLIPRAVPVTAETIRRHEADWRRRTIEARRAAR
jgi:hypothetical protein